MAETTQTNYEAIGRELTETFVDNLDSLEGVEIVLALEDKGEVLSDEEAASHFGDKSDLSANERQQAYIEDLELALRSGLEFDTKILGIPVRIIPVPEADMPPDIAGVREPLEPIPPYDKAKVELKLPNS